MTYPKPAFKIQLNNQDITHKIASRLISLTLTEHREDNSDQLDLTLSDHDGLLAIPPRGTTLILQIGWEASGLINKGEFTVDEVEHRGTPDVIIVRARTANLISQFRHPVEESYDQITLGELIKKIAIRNQLVFSIADELRHILINHIDQTRESDAAFLRRLGKKYDAAATVKNNTLLFMPASKGRTSSGKKLPLIILTRQSGDHHRYHTAERDAYNGVTVHWYNEQAGKQKTVIAGKPGNCKRLRTTWASEADAQTAALAEWSRLQRGIATFEMTLALGDAALMPMSPVKVAGFKTAIDEVDWIVSGVTHCIDESGFTTRVGCEMRTAEIEMELKKENNPESE